MQFLTPALASYRAGQGGVLKCTLAIMCCTIIVVASLQGFYLQHHWRNLTPGHLPNRPSSLCLRSMNQAGSDSCQDSAADVSTPLLCECQREVAEW